MKTIANTTQGIEEFGLICLTGEACGMWMRLLYDVTPSGKRLLEQYYGVAEIKLAENWNHSQGQIGSIMLTAAATVELCAFALLTRRDTVAVFVFRGHVIGVDNDDIEQMKEFKCETLDDYVRLAHCFNRDEWAHQYRVYRRRGDSADGQRFQHQMSGRVS